MGTSMCGVEKMCAPHRVTEPTPDWSDSSCLHRFAMSSEYMYTDSSHKKLRFSCFSIDCAIQATNSTSISCNTLLIQRGIPVTEPRFLFFVLFNMWPTMSTLTWLTGLLAASAAINPTFVTAYDTVNSNDKNTQLCEHNITIIISADNIFNLNLAGQYIRGPFDSPLVDTQAWKKINTYTQTVKGNNSFHVSVDVADFGNVAGLLAAVYVDDKLYADTGVLNNKWIVTEQPPESECWWTDEDFKADSLWHTNVHALCNDPSNSWGDHVSRFHSQAPNSKAEFMWYANCHNTGNRTTFKHNYFRIDIDLRSNITVPVPTSTLAIASTSECTDITSSVASASTASTSDNYWCCNHYHRRDDYWCCSAATTTPDAMTTGVASTTTGAITTSAASTTTDAITTSAASTTTDAATTSAASTTTDAATTSVATTTTDAMTTGAASTTTDAMTTGVASTTTDAATTSAASTTTDAATTGVASTTTDAMTTVLHLPLLMLPLPVLQPLLPTR
ncbi:hypothetical protein BDV3_001077 [Batrachochytrium dendrobatidis]